MKKIRLFIGLSVALFCATGCAWADIKLPEPQKVGGPGIFAQIEARASGTRNAFPEGNISLQEISTVLWASSGRNRDDSGWVVPTAMGRDPYVLIYVLSREGVFLYDRKMHELKQLSIGDARFEVSDDGFVRSAPYVLFHVANAKALTQFPDSSQAQSVADILSGAMSQNAYLAADALGISTRYMITFKRDAVKQALNLAEGDRVICIMPFGKR